VGHAVFNFISNSKMEAPPVKWERGENSFLFYVRCSLSMHKKDKKTHAFSNVLVRTTKKINSLNIELILSGKFGLETISRKKAKNLKN